MDKNKIIEAATKYVQKGQYDKAIKEYQKILEADAKDTRILQKVGELFQKKNDNAQAADYFLKVGESYTADGFFLKAVAVYKQVLKLDDKRIDVNLKLAELYQQLGLMSDAMAQLQIVSSHHERNGDTQATLDLLKRMVELDPDNVASRIKLAELYARDNLNGEAIEEFQKAAQYLKRNNRIDDYVKVAERLVYLDPGNVELARELAQIYLAKQDTKRALAKLQVCFKADPRDIETLTLLAQAFLDLGQTSKTISVYKELAKIYDEQDRVEEERELWERIRELAPDDPDLARRAAPAPAAAAPTYHAPAPVQSAPAPVSGRGTLAPQPSGPLTPEQIAKLLTETDVYVKYGLHDKALEHLKKVFAADPENLDAHDKAYQLAQAAGQHARAEDELLNVIRLSLAKGDATRARARLQLLLQSNPGHPEVAEFLEALGPEPEHVAEEHVEEVVDDSILIESAEDAADATDAELVMEEPAAVASGDDEALFAASGEGDEVLASSDEPLFLAGGDEPTDLAIEPGDDEALLAAAGDDEALVASADDAIIAEPEALGIEHAGEAELVESLPAGEDEALFAAASGGEDEALFAAEDPSDAVLTATTEEPFTLQPGEDATQADDLFAVPDESSGFGEDTNEITSQQPLPSSGLHEVPELPDFPEPAQDATRVVNLSDIARHDSRNATSPAMSVPVARPEDRTIARMPVARMATPASVPAAKPTRPPAAAITQITALEEEEEEITHNEPTAEEPEGDPAGDELEEAAFFISQGDLEEARDILETVMLAYPGNARAQELMQELEAKQAGGAEPEATVQSDSAFDLAAELAEELGDSTESAPAQPLDTSGDGLQISHEDVFAEFKKGVSKVVKPEDVDTHYDLGIAYKEMGLLGDAVSEFEQAMAGAVGKPREVDCLVVIGACKREMGEPAAAIEAYRRGLALPQISPDATKAMLFEIAQVHDSSGAPGKALANYLKVVALDPKFRDAQAQVARLQGEGIKPEEERANGVHVNGKSTAAAGPAAARPAPAGAKEPAGGGKTPTRKIGYV